MKVTRKKRQTDSAGKANLFIRGLKCLRENGFLYTVNIIKNGDFRTGNVSISRQGDRLRESLLTYNKGLLYLTFDSKDLYGYEELTEAEIASQKRKKYKNPIKISIIVPLYNTRDSYLKSMLLSVKEQTYSNWELCLADGSDADHSYVKEICNEFVAGDKRIKYKKICMNQGISGNLNIALTLAEGDFLAFLDHDDTLSQDALYEVAKRINEKPETMCIYTDEDKLKTSYDTGEESYVEPHFKSDFNLDLLRSCNYICHLFVVKKELVKEVGGFRKKYDGSQDYDFVLRCVEKTDHIEHIPKILYHWRMHEGSTSQDMKNKLYCYEAGKQAVSDHLVRSDVAFENVYMLDRFGFYAVSYVVDKKASVSIIIPNKDHLETLQKCIDSILNKTTYKNYQVVIVENNSTALEIEKYYNKLIQNKKIRLLKWPGKGFNYSAINNYAVEKTESDYVIFLDDDTCVISENWIEGMLGMCQRPDTGVVGAKLLYPDETVQHCGVIIGIGEIAENAFQGIPSWEPAYFGRAFVQQDLSAVSGACMMVKRSTFEAVGGFDEKLRVNYNDIDLCMRVRNAGQLIALNPAVTLYHYESESRQHPKNARKLLNKEARVFVGKWADILKTGDPYYNINLSLNHSDFRPRLRGE